jgi:ABC-type cobalamin transport system permease subunit
MSYHASFFMIMFYNMVSIGFIAAMAHIYMIILIPMVIIICLDIVNTTLPAINEASQLTRMTKSPIISHI